jgi:hypothetical protein
VHALVLVSQPTELFLIHFLSPWCHGVHVLVLVSQLTTLFLINFLSPSCHKVHAISENVY